MVLKTLLLESEHVFFVMNEATFLGRDVKKIYLTHCILIHVPEQQSFNLILDVRSQ